MSDEQRIRDLERAVAILVARQFQEEPEWARYAAKGGRIRFTFTEDYGNFDVGCEPTGPLSRW